MMEQDNIGIIIERLENLKTSNNTEHKAILDQTTKTNGTVADIQRWRFIATGSLLILNALVLPIIIAVVIKFILADLF